MASNPASTSAETVSVHALSCGHFTLPEHQFVAPSSLSARRTVPSLAFLVQHKSPHTSKTTRILFDLGLRHPLTNYPSPIQNHTENRRPITTSPDVVENLAKGGLEPDDIDYIIFSHVHWDHIGSPGRFPKSTFIVGRGSLALLSGPSTSHLGSHSFFEPDLLPPGRAIELASPSHETQSTQDSSSKTGEISFDRPWVPHPSFSLPQTLDLFGDGAVCIVNAPGHLPGHINLLLRTSSSSSSSSSSPAYMYLGGDTCHDRRLLTGEKQIGEWTDDIGRTCCIHVNRKEAEKTIERIRGLEKQGVEIVFAHDVEWEDNVGNKNRFLGAE